MIKEIFIVKDFEKSETEIETCESIEDMKYPQEYENGGMIILDDLSEREMKDPSVKAMFRRSIHNNLSIFIIRQD